MEYKFKQGDKVTCGKTTVLVTKDVPCNSTCFDGVVVDENSEYKIGYYSDSWSSGMFEKITEFSPGNLKKFLEGMRASIINELQIAKDSLAKQAIVDPTDTKAFFKIRETFDHMRGQSYLLDRIFINYPELKMQ